MDEPHTSAHTHAMTEPKDSQFPVPEEQVGAVHGYGPWPLLTLRCIIGGVMMGLASLVPAISGSTMLLASGIYPRFLQAITELTRFKFRKPSLFLLGMVALCAGLGLLVLAGTVRAATVEYRWAIYSLFIGITLGGIPVVWGLVRPSNGRVFAGFLTAFLLMVVLAFVEPGESASAGGAGFLFFAGVVAGGAMMLPGVSGALVLILLGAYLPVLDAAHSATGNGQLLAVLLPVGLGALVGAVVMSHVLARLLAKHEKPTLGALLGFLCGSLVGLAPFREFYRPAVGDLVGGVRMTAERLADLPQHQWPTRAFEPSAVQLISAVGIGTLGFLLTALLTKSSRHALHEGAAQPVPSQDED